MSYIKIHTDICHSFWVIVNIRFLTISNLMTLALRCSLVFLFFFFYFEIISSLQEVERITQRSAITFYPASLIVNILPLLIHLYIQMYLSFCLHLSSIFLKPLEVEDMTPQSHQKQECVFIKRQGHSPTEISVHAPQAGS